jgi:hypothetical protein
MEHIVPRLAHIHRAVARDVMAAADPAAKYDTPDAQVIPRIRQAAKRIGVPVPATARPMDVERQVADLKATATAIRHLAQAADRHVSQTLAALVAEHDTRCDGPDHAWADVTATAGSIARHIGASHDARASLVAEGTYLAALCTSSRRSSERIRNETRRETIRAASTARNAADKRGAVHLGLSVRAWRALPLARRKAVLAVLADLAA